MSTDPSTPEAEDAELDAIFVKLNGSGAHACYCPRSVDGGCKCALANEYLAEAKADLAAWKARGVQRAEEYVFTLRLSAPNDHYSWVDNGATVSVVAPNKSDAMEKYNNLGFHEAYTVRIVSVAPSQDGGKSDA